MAKLIKNMFLTRKSSSIKVFIFPMMILFGCQPGLINEADRKKATEGYSAGQTDKLFVVDCLLPSQLRRLGSQMTYLTAKRPIKTTAGDCEVRGGEYIAYDRANYASSLKVWLPQAKSGDAHAQVILGEIYEKGLGGLIDAKLAAKWYKKAADQGDSRAQINLGHLYEKGLGVTKNLPEALNWYRKASGLEDTDLEFASVTEADISANYEKQLQQSKEESAAYQKQNQRLQAQLSDTKKKIKTLDNQLKQNQQRLIDEKNKKNVNQQLIKKLESDLKKNQQIHYNQKAKLVTIQNSIQETAFADTGIEIIEPPLFLTRGTPSYQLRSISRNKKVVGKVMDMKNLKSLLVNGQLTEVDNKGVFEKLIKIENEFNPVEIIASYTQAPPSKLTFNLLAKGSGSNLREQNQSVIASSNIYKSVDFGRFYALIIGNNEYAQLSSLKTSVNDAKAVEQVLRKRYGYKTTLLINASRHQVMTAFNDLRKLLTEKDNLLIYYAGHGEIDKSDKSAYWLPTDAEQNNSANWLSSHSITQYLNVITARHILVVADSCYSGAMTKGSIARLPGKMAEEKRKKWLKFMVKRKARTVMTSGGEKPVLDSGGGQHSIFAKAFIRTLKQNKGLMEDYELFRKVSYDVETSTSLIGFQQSPQYSAMLHAGHEGSPFFFVPLTQ